MYKQAKIKSSKDLFIDELNNYIDFYKKVISEERENSFFEKEIIDEYKVNSCDYNIAINLLNTLVSIKLGLVVNPDLIKDFIYPHQARGCNKEKVNFFSSKIKNDKTQALAVSMACGMNNILLIQGPPGAGKTTTILEIIAQLKRKNKNYKILITSGTHVAVDNVVERILRSKTKNDEYSHLKLYDDVIRVRQKSGEDSNQLLNNYNEEFLFYSLLSSQSDNTKNIIRNYDVEVDEDSINYSNLVLSKFRSDIILKKGIIGVTINALNSCRFGDNEFDYVIVDEVGKSNFAEILFAAKFAKKLILIGDPKQLPCDVQYEFNDESNTSSFYRKLNEIPFINYLFENINKECYLFLNKQYRMVKEIGSYISDTFYNSPVKLENGRQESFGNGLNYIDYDNKRCKVACPPLVNNLEVEIIKELLKSQLLESNKKNISIITPYKAQMRSLRKAFESIIPKNNINTVDAFQGQENDIVIFTCVRNVGNPTVFFEKINRINVAISRARNQIWVIGSSTYLNNVPCLNAYINYVSKKDSSLKCNKYKYLNNNIVKVV